MNGWKEAKNHQEQIKILHSVKANQSHDSLLQSQKLRISAHLALAWLQRT
ncbi:hypothetical protein IC582_028323 [Cucumis melo]